MHKYNIKHILGKYTLLQHLFLQTAEMQYYTSSPRSIEWLFTDAEKSAHNFFSN